MSRPPVLRPDEVFVFAEPQYKFGVGPVLVRAVRVIEAVEFDGVLWWEVSAEVASGTLDNHGEWIARVYYGESGSAVGLHPDVQRALPGESQLENMRPPGVCAEARMCSNARNGGADLANLDIITLNQRGKRFKMCGNCRTQAWVPQLVRKVLTG